jgi:hypothetical protein
MPADPRPGTTKHSIVSSTISDSAVAFGKGASASLSGSSPDTVRLVVEAVAALRQQVATADRPDEATAAELRLVDQRLDDLEEEVTGDSPRPGKLRRLVEQITSGLQGVASLAGAAEALRAAMGKLLG